MPTISDRHSSHQTTSMSIASRLLMIVGRHIIFGDLKTMTYSYTVYTFVDSLLSVGEAGG